VIQKIFINVKNALAYYEIKINIMNSKYLYHIIKGWVRFEREKMMLKLSDTENDWNLQLELVHDGF